MMSHGTALSRDEAIECKRMIAALRREYSWNELAHRLGVRKMKHFSEGNGSLGQVLKDFYNGAPTLELYNACTTLMKRTSREKGKEMQLTPEQESRARKHVLEMVQLKPGVSRGHVARKAPRPEQKIVRATIQRMIEEGVLTDKYAPPARRSELRLARPLANGSAAKPDDIVHTEAFTPAPKPAQRVETSSAAPRTPEPTTPSWDTIRAKLLSAADDIKAMGTDFLQSAGMPVAMRQEMSAVFMKRHDKLLKFIEEELE